jgi:hypothetical protein
METNLMWKFCLLLWLFAVLFPACRKDSENVKHYPVYAEVAGEFAKRIDLTVRRLQSHPYDLDFIVQDVARVDGLLRRFEEYQGDISGRTLGAWSFLSRLTGGRPAKLDSIANRVLNYQSDEGYFGKNQRFDGFDMWGRQNFGHGRLLVGLVQYYLLSQEKRFLIAAEKLGDYFAVTVPNWTTEYEQNPWTKTGAVDWKDNRSNRLHFIKTHQTSVLEGLMMLYNISPKPIYLTAAREIVALFPRFGQFHSHSYLNTLVGVAMLYDVTGDPAYMTLLQDNYWRDIRQHGVPVDGSICEWFPADHRTEGCSLTDWIRLNLYMWRLTEDATYIEQVERTWLNGLNFHQTGSGAFGHANITPDGYTPDYSEAWWCCLMHGLYAYAEILEHSLVADDRSLWINLFVAGKSTIHVAGHPVAIGIQTAYPATGELEIDLSPDQPQDFAVRLRLPSWAAGFELSVNGENVNSDYHNGYLVVERKWQQGDNLRLQFPVILRVEDQNGNDLLSMRSHKDYYHTGYFFHGPLLLAADSKHNRQLPQSFDYDRTVSYIDNDITATPFSIAGTRYRIPALYSNGKSSAVLVPLGEHTSYDSWTAEIRNFVRNGEKPIQREAVQIRQRVRVIGD